MVYLKTAPLLALVAVSGHAAAFAPLAPVSKASAAVSALQASKSAADDVTRRDVFVKASAAVTAGLVAHLQSANALDTDDFLKTGQVSMPMGVSGQAGKAKPVTGIILREGSEVSRDNKGNVLAEILLGKSSDPTPVLATFSSPWPLATGTVFDVECRDASSGDGAFLTVAKGKDGKSVEDLSKSFFTDSLFKPSWAVLLLRRPHGHQGQEERNEWAVSHA